MSNFRVPRQSAQGLGGGLADMFRQIGMAPMVRQQAEQAQASHAAQLALKEAQARKFSTDADVRRGEFDLRTSSLADLARAQGGADLGFDPALLAAMTGSATSSNPAQVAQGAESLAAMMQRMGIISGEMDPTQVGAAHFATSGKAPYSISGAGQVLEGATGGVTETPRSLADTARLYGQAAASRSLVPLREAQTRGADALVPLREAQTEYHQARAAGGGGGAGGAFDYKTADANALRGMIGDLFGGVYDPISGRLMGLSKDVAPRAASMLRRAEEILREAGGELGHHGAVAQAAHEFGIDMPGAVRGERADAPPELPDAGGFEGAVIEEESTGRRFRAVGGRWIPE